MPKAKKRKPKPKTYGVYDVTITREIRHRAVVEGVAAESSEEAERIAKELADTPRSGYWREDDILTEFVRVREQS